MLRNGKFLKMLSIYLPFSKQNHGIIIANNGIELF